jgi:hypothetical protein
LRLNLVGLRGGLAKLKSVEALVESEDNDRQRELTSTSHWPALKVMIGEIDMLGNHSCYGNRRSSAFGRRKRPVGLRPEIMR